MARPTRSPLQPRRRTDRHGGARGSHKVTKTDMLSIALRMVLGIAVLVAIMFGCAARWDLPFVWAYLSVLVGAMITSICVIDRGLFARASETRPRWGRPRTAFPCRAVLCWAPRGGDTRHRAVSLERLDGGWYAGHMAGRAGCIPRLIHLGGEREPLLLTGCTDTERARPPPCQQ